MTENRLDKVPPIVALRLLPYAMTAGLVGIVQSHFAAASNLEDPAFRNRLWTPTEATGLHIVPAGLWTPELANKGPAVVVRRLGYRRMRVGLGDNRGASTPQGHEVYHGIWTGGHRLLCVAKEEAEVEVLGAEVGRMLDAFSSDIRRALHLMRFSVTEIGPPAKLRRSKDRWAVPVPVEYAWNWSYTLRMLAPRLKTIAGGLTTTD
jgi:hypothetical protein